MTKGPFEFSYTATIRFTPDEVYTIGGTAHEVWAMIAPDLMSSLNAPESFTADEVVEFVLDCDRLGQALRDAHYEYAAIKLASLSYHDLRACVRDAMTPPRCKFRWGVEDALVECSRPWGHRGDHRGEVRTIRGTTRPEMCPSR